MSATATEKATAATGMVTWRRHLRGANAIRVSYSNGRVLSDWILVKELPELKSDWPPEPIDNEVCYNFGGLTR